MKPLLFTVFLIAIGIHATAQTSEKQIPPDWTVRSAAAKLTPTLALPVQDAPAPKADAQAQAETKSKDEKPRVFVSDSKSWAIAGGFAATRDAASGSIRGGARPQTAEIIKTVGERCPEVIVTMKQEKADYVLLLEHEGGKPLLLRDNKFALFDKDGDSLKSGSARSLGNAVKDSCDALIKDWQKKRP